jgi:ABC transporter substrate binding protein
MRRREFITLLGAAVVWPRTVTAQSPSKVYRVGSLNTAAPVADNSPFGAALIRGLAQHGYAVNGNLTFERRGAEMHMDRLPRLVDELVASKVDVIVAIGYPSALAAKQGTTLPVVSISAGDPVGTGLVDGLARPGGKSHGHLGRVGGNYAQTAGPSQGNGFRAAPRGDVVECSRPRHDTALSRG